MARPSFGTALLGLARGEICPHKLDPWPCLMRHFCSSSCSSFFAHQLVGREKDGYGTEQMSNEDFGRQYKRATGMATTTDNNKNRDGLFIKRSETKRTSITWTQRVQRSQHKQSTELNKKPPRTRCGEINLYGNHMVCSE